MTFHLYRHIFYKILYCIINILLLLALLLATTACRINLDMPAKHKQTNPAYTITANDINTIDFDNAPALITSLETIFGWLVGADHIPKNLSDDLRAPNSRFLASAIINDYKKQKVKPNFDILLFRKQLLVELGKKHDINLTLTTRQLQ